MRLLLDQNLSLAVAATLRLRDFDAVHTREVELASASDDVILDRCRRDRRVAITRDADFHAILARTAATSPSVVREFESNHFPNRSSSISLNGS
jgi:predicted nuclease of predicted toxin-antitoxin system